MMAIKNLFLSLMHPKNFGARAFLSSAYPREQIVKVGKHSINYLRVGNGPHSIFCVPGALGSIWTHYKHQIDGFDYEKFSIVVWDPPGFGKSRPPEKDFNINFYHEDADVAYEFMKELRIPKYSVLGWSGGAVTSMVLAAKYPKAVQKLAIWGASSFLSPSELEVYKKMKDTSLWSKEMKEPMIELYGEERFKMYLAQWIETTEALCKEKDGNICSEVLKNIKCPTFILYGEKDPLVEGVHVSHLHTHITGSRIHLYPEGKHNIHIRYADDFNKIVQEFLLSK